MAPAPDVNDPRPDKQTPREPLVEYLLTGAWRLVGAGASIPDIACALRAAADRLEATRRNAL